MGTIHQDSLSQIQYASSHKQILVPTMASVGAVFSQHLSILRDLKNKIENLEQTYFKQKDKDRTWKEVDAILLALRNGCKFLDFPEDDYLNQFKTQEKISEQDRSAQSFSV